MEAKWKLVFLYVVFCFVCVHVFLFLVILFGSVWTMPLRFFFEAAFLSGQVKKMLCTMHK